jgi:hypothetical protein
MKMPELKNIGSLITYGDGAGQTAVGYLLDMPGRGVFDARLGKVDISPEAAATHNRFLDAALIEGLDTNCAIGMRGTFYHSADDGKVLIKTWGGTLVSDQATLRGGVLTFKRKGMTFRGRVQRDAECFNFRRVA